MAVTTTTNPIQRYDEIRATSDFIFVVCTSTHRPSPPSPSTSQPTLHTPTNQNSPSTVYRGHWCPFCQAYLKQLQSLTSRISAAGGHVLTVTAESETELPKMRQATGYDGETIVDVENLLVKELARRGIIDVAISEKKGYPHGMAQPAVLIGTKQKVVYKWAIVPAVVGCRLLLPPPPSPRAPKPFHF